jgi:hypothetical protein
VSEAVEEKWVVGISLCVAAEVVPCMLALLGNSKGGAMILLDKKYCICFTKWQILCILHSTSIESHFMKPGHIFYSWQLFSSSWEF